MPKLSVIVCTFNRLNYLKILLNSLANNERSEDFDVWVIDNSNNHETQAFFESNFPISIGLNYRRVESRGASFARNAGIEFSSSEYLLFIDDDCALQPNAIDQVIHFIQTNQPSVFTAPISGVLPFNKAHCIPMNEFVSELDQDGKPTYLASTILGMKRSLCVALGGFDVNFGPQSTRQGYGEDTILEIKLAGLGVEIKSIPELKVYHFSHGVDFKLWLVTRMNLTFDSLRLSKLGFRKARSPFSQFVTSLKQFIHSILILTFKLNTANRCQYVYRAIGDCGVMLGWIKFLVKG